MKRKRFSPIFAFLFVCSSYLFAQEKPLLYNEDLSNFLESHPGEKVYLHTDREIYSVNDSLWFKIYITDAHTHVPITGLQSVYVELIDELKNIQVRNLILTNNGFGMGDFDLSDYKLVGGKYQLRAYSAYQRNFGDEFLFSKNILLAELYIGQTAGPEVQKPKNQKRKNPPVQVLMDQNTGSIDLQFMPEGGYLSYGCPCRIAFIARDTNNKPVGVSGWIVDGNEQKITRFSTSHQGMGTVFFIPQKDKEYKAVIDNYDGAPVMLPASTNKVQFSVETLKDSIIGVSLWDYGIHETPVVYHLISSSQGKIKFYCEIKMDEVSKQMMLGVSKFEAGINKLTLVDSLMRPVAERLIFVKKDDLLTVTAKIDRQEYAKRDKVSVVVHTNTGSQGIAANLSVSVVNKAQVIELEEYPQNVLSYLLLDSELQGSIANPSFYFKDDSISTSKKLDLVMLTHGWRNYNWNKFKDQLPDTIFKREQGLEVSGKIKRLFSPRGVEDGTVTIFMKGKMGFFFVNVTNTDSVGEFCFPSSIFPDSVSVFLQGVNKRNRNNVEVINLSSFQAAAPVRNLSFSIPGEEQQSTFKEMAYKRLSDDREYHPGKYEILLEEVQVVKEKETSAQNTNDGHNRIYGIADNVIVVDDKAFTSNIWTFISSRVPGVMASGNSVTLRGNTPIFLLDGTQVDKGMLDGIPVTDIDKIEVLKSATNLAVFGVKGANGVIAVYTKLGEITYTEPYYKGILSDKLRGYYSTREFYSPNYEANPNPIPDHRATIYWNPEVISDSTGIATFSFFTSDDPGSLLLKVEGISFDGKPGVGFVTIPRSD